MFNRRAAAAAAVAVLLAVGAVVPTGAAGSQPPGGEVVGVRAWSDEAGVLRVAWEAASPVPADYRVRWAPQGDDFRPWTDSSGNAFPVSSSLVLEGLDAGRVYRVQVRARYSGGRDGGPWSGPWSGAASGSPSGGDVAGTVLSGVMSWGAFVSGGSDVVGYKRGQPSGSDAGGFEMRYWDGEAVRSNDLRALGQIQGSAAAGPAAGLDHPVVLTMSTAADLSSGFMVEVGDYVYDSADAVDPAGTAGVYRYWMWDSPVDRWQLGGEAEFRVIAKTGSPGGADGADAGLELEGAALGGGAPGLARFSVGESGPVAVLPDARRYDVELSGDATQTTVSLEANAFDVRLEARTVRADRFALTGQDLAQPVYLSEGGDTLVIVHAQSPDGAREQVYLIGLQRPRDGTRARHSTRSGSGPALGKGASTVAGVRDSDAAAPSLSALALSPGTLVPAFSAAVRDYTASVPSGVSQITVTPTAADGTSVLVAAPDADTDTAGHQVALNASTQTASAQTAIVVVVSNSAGRLDSYTIIVTRAAGSASDADLSAFAVGDLALRPAFDPAATSYTAITDADTVTVTATAAQPAATIAVTPADSDGTAAGHQVGLAVGDNTVTVTVTAQDSTTKAYTVTVTRLATLSSDATLARLDLSGAQLSPRLGDASFPQVTMELPDGCELHDLGAGSLAPFQSWDDTCKSLAVADHNRRRAARYYRLYVHKESLVHLKIESHRATYLVLRSAAGHVIDEDVLSEPWEFDRYHATIYDYDAEVNVMLARGVYVVEAASVVSFPDRASFGHRLRYRGLGIIKPLQVQSGDEDITEILVGDDTHIHTASALYDADSVTVDAAASHDGARVIVSPPDADPDTDGHQVALAEPAADAISTKTTVAVAVVAHDGTRNTYAVVVTRPPPPPTTTRITKQLPGSCELHDLGNNPDKTPLRRWDELWRRWDHNCGSLYWWQDWGHDFGGTDFLTNYEGWRQSFFYLGAQYYRLFVRTESLVHLWVDGNSSSELVIRSPSGEILHHDGTGLSHWYWGGRIRHAIRHEGRLTVVLPRGVYLVEAAATWHHFDRRGHSLVAMGEGIERPLAYRLDGIDISDVGFNRSDAGFNRFDPSVTDYHTSVAADVTSVTVTPNPASGASAVEVSPADADPDAPGHQVTLDPDGTTDITVKVYGTSFASHFSADEIAEITTTYTFTLYRLPEQVTITTMDLPAGCELHELHPGIETPWRSWNYGCDSLYWIERERSHFYPSYLSPPHVDHRGAQFYLLNVPAEGRVSLEVVANSSSRLLIRSSSGEILHHDYDPHRRRYNARLSVVLPSGLYIVEAGNQWHHLNNTRGHTIRYNYEAADTPQS